MSRLSLFASLSIVLAVGVMLAGCSNQPSNQPAAQPDAAQDEAAEPTSAVKVVQAAEGQLMWTCSMHPQIQQPKPGDCPICGMDLIPVAKTSGHAEHADQTGHSQYAEALAELSPADRELAENQETCPVSGEPLGAMGKPYKVTVQGREVFLCCPGCETEIQKNPEKYLAKLSE